MFACIIYRLVITAKNDASLILILHLITKSIIEIKSVREVDFINYQLFPALLHLFLLLTIYQIIHHFINQKEREKLMKPYSLDLRQQIVNAYKNKEGSMLKIACKFHVSRSFVQKLIKQERETGSIAPLTRVSGYESKLLPNVNIIKQLLNENPNITLKQLCDAIEQITGTAISQSAMYRFLHQHQLNKSMSSTKSK